MKKLFLLITILMLALCYASTVQATEIEKDDNSIIVQRGMIVEEKTSEIFTCYDWQLAQTDASSEYIETKTTVSTSVTATTGTEAIAKVEGSSSAGCEYVGLGASMGTEVGINIHGEMEYNWTVSGTKITKRIQYYDLYEKYEYSYYVVVWRDQTSGQIVQRDLRGVLIRKTYVCEELRQGRYTAP
ncbi:hypothetical protein [Vallitalea maricola]|uniref:Uncharacterized protein n=1 Tax=Vallitalea maricola TaxID=3074433 RepID=A0ACB5UNR8_9FIRM|nr:hypothetical protein AN2V17_34310 [Vallitalea sp. AN17-2]